MLESLFNKIKKILQHWCFPVNVAKFLRTDFFLEHLCWMLLGLQEAIHKGTISGEKKPRRVAKRCSVKKLFLEISQNSEENTCARVYFFNKVAGSASETLILLLFLCKGTVK